MRCALRDVEEEDIAPHFEPATAFLRSAFAGGGKVLGAMPQSMCLERGVFCLSLDQHLDVMLFSQEVSQGRMCMWTHRHFTEPWHLFQLSVTSVHNSVANFALTCLMFCCISVD